MGVVAYAPKPRLVNYVCWWRVESLHILSSFYRTIVHQVLRRSGKEEKILVVVKKRSGHHCSTAVVVVSLVLWEGLTTEKADFLYRDLSAILPQHGLPTIRQCGINVR